MRLKLLKTITPRSFNKRFINQYNYKYFIKFKINLVVNKQILFEFIYFKIIKLFFKKSLKYKYQIFKNFFFFFNLIPNYPISIKNKNSRMGKGIGKFLRWSFLLKSNTILFSFASFYLKRFFFLLIKLKKRISKHLFLILSYDNY